MIKIDIYYSIAILLSITVSVFFMRWMTVTRDTQKTKDTFSFRNLIQCPFCSYLFFNYDKEEIKTCPRCQSYLIPTTTQKKSG